MGEAKEVLARFQALICKLESERERERELRENGTGEREEERREETHHGLRERSARQGTSPKLLCCVTTSRPYETMQNGNMLVI